ncbi:hypothetical protein NQ176_g1958 [Zarea fungicola]|uniref:Uncharacterized protein n=1 Tax=Zarea fungicola TaxID=93591 RepID=A0ACC1NRJ6_9HYPO|nr:hypothetical protein NQ176_g1958 [Lecanicillium fungicola]
MPPMPATNGHSHACCNIPPVVVEGYAAKGSYEQLGGTKTSKLPAFIDSIRATYPGITKWGLIGYCWGGKVTELITSSLSNPFTVAASVHPAMINPEGAKSISVPYLLLASGEESAADVAAFENGLSVPHQVETFSDQIHGWMAARADLSDPRVREEYARGYQTVLEFFGKHFQSSPEKSQPISGSRERNRL